MSRHLIAAFLAMAIAAPFSIAQGRGRISSSHTGFAHGGGRTGGHHQSNRFSRGIYPGLPFFFSDYDSGYDDSNDASIVDGSVATSAPRFVVLQPAADSLQTAKAAPLLIEWRGDRYVRFGGVRDTGAETKESGDSSRADYVRPTTATTEPPARSLNAPTVLVYRDGRSEEISDYAIVGSVIYAGGNYWQNGHWTKNIPLSALDLDATVQANQQRGIKFLLPSASNVVIASF